MNIKVRIVSETATLPNYQTAGAAGFDLHASENFTIQPGQTVMVDTGVAYEIPEGFELQVRPRSGLAYKNGIQVANSPGTVDSDFRGSVKVLMFNSSQNNFPVSIGDRIAQGVITQYERATFVESEHLTETARGTGGMGSTGV